MIKYIITGLCLLFLLNISAYAAPVKKSTVRHKQEVGLGIGALIGGLLGGPPGAIIGAAGGAWYGTRDEKKDVDIHSMENRLLEKESELVYLQNEFEKLKTAHGREIQKVKHEKNSSTLEALSKGISLNVYFRTDSDNIEPETSENLKRLANYLGGFPEIKLHLDATADIRGTDEYNRQLSLRRAQAVAFELIRSGIDQERIRSHAYGESRAIAKSGDQDGYAFDRRVTIYLTLDTET